MNRWFPTELSKEQAASLRATFPNLRALSLRLDIHFDVPESVASKRLDFSETLVLLVGVLKPLIQHLEVIWLSVDKVGLRESHHPAPRIAQLGSHMILVSGYNTIFCSVYEFSLTDPRTFLDILKPNLVQDPSLGLDARSIRVMLSGDRILGQIAESAF